METKKYFLRKNNSIMRARILFLTLIFATSGFIASAQTLGTFNFTNGGEPVAALTLGADGNFYGTTQQGGVTNSIFTYGMGTVFKMTTNGTLTTLVSFVGTNGATPYAALTLGADGNFYGTTFWGGITNSTYSRGMGTVFKMTTNGTLTTLVSFVGTNGGFPEAALTLGNDGNFYGTTYEGGTNDVSDGGMGTVFKMTTNGTLTTLVSFNGGNGASPHAALTLGTDGIFYGTTGYNAYSGQGTVFKVTTNGILTTLASFSGTNGANPYAALTLGADGNFYGTTDEGSGNDGTVFKVTTNGILTTLAFFYGTNGMYPYGALTLGADGDFYGTTFQGGSFQYYGTVFKVTTNGTLTTLVSFNFNNGAYPEAGLTVGTDGNLYGTTQQGGSGGWGTVFCLSLPPTITVQPQSQTNNADNTVILSVTATSFTPLCYQWSLNSSNILGATNSTLVIPRLTQTDLGYYTVLVANAFGSVASSNATLSMYPFIATPFTGAITYWGKSATFNVSVWGTGPLSYQWFENGLAIQNATNQTFSLSSVQFTNAGLYSVVVSSPLGIVTNTPGQVVVEPAGVSLGFCPALTISGVVGYSYVIQSTTNLMVTNAWVTLTNLTLTQPVQIWVDTSVDASSPFYPNYFYKVLPGQ